MFPKQIPRAVLALILSIRRPIPRVTYTFGVPAPFFRATPQRSDT